MDFTVQLRQIKFNGDENAGTLTQRYRLFAELFLGKLSEAKAAGFQLPENVIKLTFTRAVSASPILQGWCEQHKWISAAETHRRITNQLKMVDAYSTLTGMVQRRRANNLYNQWCKWSSRTYQPNHLATISISETSGSARKCKQLSITRWQLTSKRKFMPVADQALRLQEAAM